MVENQEEFYSECNDENDDNPINIVEGAAAVVADLLPRKSKERYEKEYDIFKKWCCSKKVGSVTEDVLLVYFAEASKKYKASTLWSMYSMLKAVLLIKEDIKIANFSKLVAYLKRKSTGYQAKKSRVFSRTEINEFIRKAANNEFLMMKVVLIMGLAGACRCDELMRLTLDDIEDKDNVLVVKIPNTKNYKPRSFIVVEGEDQQISNIGLFRKYVALQLSHTPHRRLFVSYRQGKCSTQPVGIHTYGKIPQRIATFLGLPNSMEYTGHCLRRTSATLLVDAGGDIPDLKRHGGWNSAGVAKGYIAESLENKRAITKKIQGAANERSSSSTENTNEINVNGTSLNANHSEIETSNLVEPFSSRNNSSSGIHISNVQNTTININVTYR